MAAAATSCSSLLLLLASLSAFFFFHGTAAHTLAAAGGGVRTDTTTASGDGGDAKVYIVFTERLPAAAEPSSSSEQDTSAAIASYHHDLLGTVLDGSSSAPDRVVYHYSRGLHGFAARLTRDERNRLAEKEAVLSIHEKVVYRPQTTRSWDFLGLPMPPQHNKHHPLLPFENDVIIGMVDTGIWPESQSFSDDGLPPPPAKWKGVCSNFTCNNKIIGARAYQNGRTTLSPRDTDGHGTHTASTAAGRPVPGASLGGLAGGTARGGAPGARLAIYKVCWGEAGCSSEDLLAAFDDAIADGVDVLSASLGTPVPFDYADDTMAVAAFHAMRRGVVTSVAAGNDGPVLGSVSNVAPWMVVVGAVTTDRKIVSELVLGDGRRVVANSSINAFFPHLGKPALLVDPGGGCTEEQLKGKRYKGALLLCGYDMDSDAFAATGAHGAVLYSLMPDDDGGHNVAFSFAHPTMLLNREDYDHIVHYYNTTNRNPMATVRSSVTIKDASSPSVASFSSRGPSMITHGVLKPDMSAPGVDILAAWSGAKSVSGVDADARRTKYNIISGTSMATPHVTAAAAYVKSVHPAWSHAAVLSALVTTATPMTAGSSPEAELAYGAGLVNPLGARYPGLVYDASEADYVAFLCAQGYNASQLATIIGRGAKHAAGACRPAKGKEGATHGGADVGSLKYPSVRSAVGDLNYPSVAVPVLNYGVPFAAEFPRTVTNVGPADSVYRATVTCSVRGVDVTVTPDELAFSAGTKKLSFTVRVSGSLASVNGSLGASASVVWSDGRHRVRSPVYVFPYKHVM